jgi:hypothetical protein
MTKEQTTIYETLHRKRKLNIEQHKPQVSCFSGKNVSNLIECYEKVIAKCPETYRENGPAMMDVKGFKAFLNIIFYKKNLKIPKSLIRNRKPKKQTNTMTQKTNDKRTNNHLRNITQKKKAQY